MRTVIIDDEPKGRQTLTNFITKYAPGLNLIGEADCVQSGIELIEKQKPELVFLDVQMPDGTGFDLLGQLQYNNFQLIFCTSFDNYAIKAFRFSAIDYLLKPVDPDTFKAAIAKVTENNQPKLESKLDVLNSNKTNFTRIALHSSEGINLVNINDIIRCESDVNYTKFFLKDGYSILVSKTLKEFDSFLSEHGFIRVHKSSLVNINHISKYIKGEGGCLIMSDGAEIVVSRRKREQLLQILSNL